MSEQKWSNDELSAEHDLLRARQLEANAWRKLNCDAPVNLSRESLVIAAPAGARMISQPVLSSTSLTVIKRAASAGGGVLLVVRGFDGRRYEMVLDERARNHLVNALSGPLSTLNVNPAAE